MCGILGIARNRPSSVGLSDLDVARMRDTMVRRGPDGSGLWREPTSGHLVLAHRRLAVIDPGETGAQPMQTPVDPSLGGPRFTIVYNGELYNDAELRRDLGARGVRFSGSCDTETVLRAFEVFGLDAIGKLRGMFALGIFDAKMRTLTLARDPLGVKPLYYRFGEGELIFASDPRAILAHPRVTPEPNMRMVSAYMTTIRAALGGETLFEGVRTLAPGHMMLIDLDGSPGATPHAEARRFWRSPAEEAPSDRGWADEVRGTIEDSLSRHLRADVPTCALLSGGLDSAITATLARDHLPGLRTYCAGDGQSVGEGDLFHARAVARRIGSGHSEALLDARSFNETWRWMVSQNGMPMCTPNETAIFAVASRLREDGCVVTISGEGADELFAGYEPPLDTASSMLASSSTGEGAGIFELGASAWTPTDFKQGILDQEVWHLIERDGWLMESYEREFASCIEEAGGYHLGAHQRFYRRINLTGLLRRLDSATMLAGVEGRTPFADARVAELAERIPMGARFAAAQPVAAGGGSAVGAPSVRSKLVLREAFGDRLPAEVVRRPKASFPLPFQDWMSSSAHVLGESDFARSIFQRRAIETVRENPSGLWNLAWPMINLALWGDAMGW